MSSAFSSLFYRRHAQTSPRHYLASSSSPGAWTAPKAYHKLIGALEAKTFKVHVPALPTNNGQQPPNSTFDADIQTVRESVQPLVDAGQEVVMLMHSYGGIAGTSAIRNLTRKDRQARNLPGDVVSLVYAAGFMPSKGQTIRTVVQALNLPGRNSLVKFSSDHSTWFPIDPIWLLYHDLAPDDQEEEVKLLKWGNAAILTGQITYAAWKDEPTLYIRSLKDHCQNDTIKQALLLGCKNGYPWAPVGI